MDEKAAAKQILESVGENNIKNITHCATRIRIEPINMEAIKELEENDIIKGSLFTGNQYQVFVNLSYIQEVFEILKVETKSNPR